MVVIGVIIIIIECSPDKDVGERDLGRVKSPKGIHSSNCIQASTTFASNAFGRQQQIRDCARKIES
jgi:hypothetical protein